MWNSIFLSLVSIIIVSNPNLTSTQTQVNIVRSSLIWHEYDFYGPKLPHITPTTPTHPSGTLLQFLRDNKAVQPNPFLENNFKLS